MDENNHEGEEDYIFNEYSIDDTLDPLSRLVKYHTSDFSLQRLVLIRELTDTAIYAGFQETVRMLIPLLSQFVSDSEPAVRQMFVQQLPSLAAYLVESGAEQGYQQLINTFIPYGFELLVDKNVEVGCAALQTLNKLADLVRPANVEQHLLNVVISLAHDERAEDYRVVAAQLFNDFAPKFGEQLCLSMVLNEVKLLSNDMSFTVRKAVGSNLGNICKIVGATAAVEKVLPIYVNLTKDEIWGVRKACAENMISVSEHITPQARASSLVNVFKALSEDASRWVRVAAYQVLGQFIHTMRREDVTPMFLKVFTDMAFQSEGGDSDFAEYCSFSFPAVVQVVGKERWRELDDAFATLLKDVQWKVRKSLAHSLHEVASVVGLEISERSLAVAFELFLRDLDEVKLGVILNSDKFLANLGPVQREKLVPMICAVPVESENWRLRNAVAQKLGELGRLVPPKSAAQTAVTTLSMKLLDDSVTEVRMSSFRSTAMLLSHLSSSPAEYQAFLGQVQALASRPNYQSRQMYAYISQQAVELGATAIVEKDLADCLTALATDKVNNVRFVVARVLANSVINNPQWKAHPKMKQIATILAEDVDADVKTMIKADLPRLTNAATAAAYRVV